MSESISKERRKTSSRYLDFFVIVLCITGVAASLYMFYTDLFSTYRSTSEPAGTVIIKYNTVQRRISDRVVWDRLFNDSHVYNGDLIRVARLSGAELDIDDNQIELGESTLIRIQKDKGVLNIQFFEGDINITSNKEGETVLLSVGNRVVEASPGTVFSASYGESGTVLRITEGDALIFQEGRTSAAPAGTVIIQDAQGNEIIQPMAAVIYPRPNARLLKPDQRALNVEFAWERINLQDSDRLKLEISEDRNFSRVSQVIENLDKSAAASVNPGLWHWRLSHEGNVLTTGRMTVTDAVSPTLFTPAEGYIEHVSSSTNSSTQFRWSEVSEAVAYILQVSETPSFHNPEFSVQVQGTFYSVQAFDAGTYFWRVLPVFSSAHEGVARFSQSASFKVEQVEENIVLELRSPAADDSLIIGEGRQDFHFTWAASRFADYYTFMISANRDLSRPIININLRDNFYTYKKEDNTLSPGYYYWGVSYTDKAGITSSNIQIQTFIAAAGNEDVEGIRISAAPIQPVVRDPIPPVQVVVLAPPPVQQRSEPEPPPVQQQRQAPPLRPVTPPPPRPAPRPVTPPPTPAAAVATVQPTPSPAPLPAPTPTASVQQPAQILETEPAANLQITEPAELTQPVASQAVVQPVIQQTAPAEEPQTHIVLQQTPQAAQAPPLPMPQNRLPANGHNVGAEELRLQRFIPFNWTGVEGANSYILTIYRDASPHRQQIFQTEVSKPVSNGEGTPANQFRYNFENLRLLESSGIYIWQVEAVSYNSNDMIERRGDHGENSFVIDVPRPGRVRTRDLGVLYGIR